MNNKYWVNYCAEAAAKQPNKTQNCQLETLSDPELGAVLLSSLRGSASDRQNLEMQLAALKAEEAGSSTVEELSQRFRLDASQALALSAALELGRRSSSIRYMSLTTPENAMCYINDMSSLPKEHFRALCLDTKKRLLKMDTISIGDLSSSIAHPREIFYPAVQNLADSIIVAHNHPSGDPSPSDADLKLTSRLSKAGELLGIKLIDHIIVGAGCYISLRREGVIKG